MARYIDAEIAKKFIQQEAKKIHFLTNEPEHIISKAYLLAIKHVIEDMDYVPTADVAEVVRCKDCKRCNFYYPAKPIGEDAIEAYFCKVWERYTEPNVFCSYGERKENEL